jgi:hypothetical protein
MGRNALNPALRVPDAMAWALQCAGTLMRSIVACLAVCLTSTGCNALLGNGSGDVPVSDDDAGSVAASGSGTAGGSSGGSGAADGHSGGAAGQVSMDAWSEAAEPDARDIDASFDSSDASGERSMDASRDADALGTVDSRPVDPAASLDGQRWDLPCGTVSADSQVCQDLPPGISMCPPAPGSRTVDKTISFGGVPGKQYLVDLRFRGIVEPKDYEGGADYGGHLYVGGMPAPKADGGLSQYNVYSLTVSSPPKVLYLNFASTESRYVFPIDSHYAVSIDAGAKVTLGSTDLDCTLVRNCMDVKVQPCEPYVVPNVPPASGYDGQFILMNVLSVTEK